MLDDLFTPTHLIFLLVLALLIFGPRRLPEIGSALGRGIRDFRNAVNHLDHNEKSLSPETKPVPPTQE